MKKEMVSFQTFDKFIIQKMGAANPQTAWQILNQKLNPSLLPASIPTMKRWFGIDSYAIPSREQIFLLAFSLQLSPDECSVYLTTGLWQPSFQVNDYHETVLLYGLENHLSYDECQSILIDFENRLETEIPISQTHSTAELMTQFQRNKHLPTADFLEWMIENGTYFKGYSRTALSYMKKYQNLIIRSAREDALELLHRELAETDYHTRHRHPFAKKSESESIRNYLYKNMKNDTELRDQLLYLTKLAYYTEDSNVHLIRELFSVNIADFISRSAEKKRVPSMSEKRMSDLLSMGLQRDRILRAKIGIQKLHHLSPNESCPAALTEAMVSLGIFEKPDKKATVSQALFTLEAFVKKQKNRCLLIQRSDLLPMILYMVERDYMKQQSDDMNLYGREDALAYFEEIANSTLSACSMALLNRDYLPDNLIYQCFQEDELVSLSDVLELSECD